MVGSPGQTAEHLAEDMLFIQKLNPQMVGIGPFIPHHDTPFAKENAGTEFVVIQQVVSSYISRGQVGHDDVGSGKNAQFPAFWVDGSKGSCCGQKYAWNRQP